MNLIHIDEIRNFLFELDWNEHEKNISKDILEKFMYMADSSWGMPFKAFEKCEKYGYFIVVPQEEGNYVNMIWSEK